MKNFQRQAKGIRILFLAAVLCFFNPAFADEKPKAQKLEQLQAELRTIVTKQWDYEDLPESVNWNVQH